MNKNKGMNKLIIFPERTDKIKALSKLSSFPVDNGAKTLYSLTVEMTNGDVINFYHPHKKEAEKFKVGATLVYEMKKEKEGDKVKNKFHSYAFSDLSPDKIKKSVALLPFLRKMRMEDLTFIDIETVRGAKTITTKDPLYASWAYKRRYEDEVTAKDLKASFKEKAPLFAEFGKIVCISVASVKDDSVRKISYYGDNEKDLLERFSKDMRRKMKAQPNSKLCGHSIIRFDIPYIYKRMLVNGLPIPEIFNISFQKPWVLSDKYLDIAEMWDATSFHRSSLINITTALGLDSPKGNLDGSMVSEAYYGGKIDQIVEYCEGDVLAVINIMAHMFGKETFSYG